MTVLLPLSNGAWPTMARLGFDRLPPPTAARSMSLVITVTFENTVRSSSSSATRPSPLRASSSTP